MTANEEKNELVVVDVPNVQIYAFTVSGWPTPRTAEEVLNAARKSTAESIQLCAVLAVPVLVHPPGVTAAKFVINGGAVNPQSFRDTLHADPIEVIFFQLPTILNRQMSAAQSSLIPLVS